MTKYLLRPPAPKPMILLHQSAFYLSEFGTILANMSTIYLKLKKNFHD